MQDFIKLLLLPKLWLCCCFSFLFCLSQPTGLQINLALKSGTPAQEDNFYYVNLLLPVLFDSDINVIFVHFSDMLLIKTTAHSSKVTPYFCSHQVRFGGGFFFVCSTPLICTSSYL